MIGKSILLGLSVVLTGSAAASAVEPSYEACMRLARVEPEHGLAVARSWRDLGGGGAARHCEAVSLTEMGRHADAATVLEDLAKRLPDMPGDTRAELLAQAGQAWLRADRPERAYAMQSAALELAPESTAIRVDRATSAAAAGDYWQAIDDLNAVVERDPTDADALVLRASAYRLVDSLDLAREDAERALALAPEHPEGLLEYGNVLRLQGDAEAARHTWIKLVRLHEGRPAADAAQRNLEALDVRTAPPAQNGKKTSP